MKCIGCKQELIETAAATGMGYVYLNFCENKKCARYQLFTYVDLVKKDNPMVHPINCSCEFCYKENV